MFLNLFDDLFDDFIGKSQKVAADNYNLDASFLKILGNIEHSMNPSNPQISASIGEKSTDMLNEIRMNQE